MKLNPHVEVSYRMRLAQGFLRESIEAFQRSDYRGAVASAQLCVENAAKAVIALFRVPSWSHDPSSELSVTIPSLPAKLRRKARLLASIARRLASEHGRSTYGLADRRVTPSMIYGEAEAKDALKDAKRALRLAEAIPAGLGYAT